ncbi:YIP1 family protein [Ignavibacterium sp.]|uniref:YIP1 family protein n=1 Tax=Ignavibacterium sp. TaxID=2651167 RepID=UPI00307EF78D
MDNNELLPNEQTSQETELSHSDKMIGVFTEPSKTFESIAKFPVRSIDWVLPIVIIFILIGLMRSLAMLNVDVVLQTKQKQIEMFDKMVSEGKMTQEQADQAIEGIDKQMEFMRGPLGWVINVVSTLIFGFIFFFIIAGIYFLFIKFFLKGEGSYQHVLVASGLTSYILMIQVLIGGILTFLLGKIVMDTSVANFIELEQGSIVKFFLSKVDPISIWAYSVLSIGLAKLNRAQNTVPYFILVFALWILGGLLFFFLGKVFPFLGDFGG